MVTRKKLEDDVEKHQASLAAITELLFAILHTTTMPEQGSPEWTELQDERARLVTEKKRLIRKLNRATTRLEDYKATQRRNRDTVRQRLRRLGSRRR